MPAILYGTTGPIGGGEIAGGSCFTGQVTIAGATVGMPVQITPTTFPGNGSFWFGYVDSANSVTVKLCNTLAGTLPATVFTVAVFNSGVPAGGPTLETNGTPNTLQTLLNLISGSGITLTADGAGGVTIASSAGGGNVTAGATLTADDPIFGAGTFAVKVGSKSGNTDELASVSSVGAAGNLATWDASGNLEDGGAPAAGTVTNSGTLTADDPIFGNGTTVVKVGSKSGNTDELASVSSVGAAGNLARWDASGNLEDGGAPATGTVTNSGTLTADDPIFGNGTTVVKVGSKSGNTDELASVSSVGATGHLATWDASGNLADGGTTTPPSFTTQNVVTGSRSLGTVFHNTTGKPMFVMVVTCSATGALESLVDSFNPPTDQTGQAGASTNCNTLGFMVPNGFFYEVTGTSGATFAIWVEYS